MQSEYEKETKQRSMIMFDGWSEDGITGSRRPLVSCVLMTDAWRQATPDAAGPQRRWTRLTSASSCMIGVWPSRDQRVA